MGERAVCPVCSRETALSPRGYFHRHGRESDPCIASGATYRQSESLAVTLRAVAQRSAKPIRPTILIFHGETGSHPIEHEEWACDIGAPGWAVRGYLDPEYEDPPPMCPAPAPEAP
jgi:hypothetical protein